MAAGPNLKDLAMKRGVEAMKALLARFARDTSGSIAIMWGLSAIVVIGMVGAAIDYSRAVNVKEVMAQELDGAVLAGARYLSSSTDTDKTKTQIVDTFSQTTERVLGDQATYGLTPDDITINQEAGTITATAKGAVQTAFMKILGIDMMPLAVTSQASFSDKYLEIALVLDVTGSMNDPAETEEVTDRWGRTKTVVVSTKIEALRTAAKELVDKLIPDDTSDRVRISIIPYSAGVQLDESLVKTATNGYSRKCATERTGDEEYTDASYTTEPIGDGSGVSQNAVLYAEGNSCPQSKILPLTNNRQTLLNAINALSANGNTAGQTGIAWGWYTLSPNWSSLWGGNSQPAAYSDEETLKYAIIMSDGDFNTYYKYDYACLYGNGYYCYNYSRDKYWYTEYSNNLSSERGRKTCDAMKNSSANSGHGINIYSVFLSADSGTQGEQTLEYCASGSDQFVHATDGQALVGAFVRFASDIQKLYLSK